MNKFKHIYLHAAKRKGGEEQLLSLLSLTRPNKQLVSIQDDRVLAQMTKCIFQAGFSWKVVEKKWPDFELAFKQFNPKNLQYLSAEELELLAKDARIIRNMQKIVTVPKNAQWISEIAEQYGSYAKFLAQWPVSDQVGLFKHLKNRGARLGGNTGPRFLRSVGYDSFILTRDVLLALAEAKIDFTGTATSARDLKQIQSAFNQWHDETQFSYTQLSKILAFSAGDNSLQP